MKILGIESSCDDTSLSIVDNNKNIIANEVLSQNNIHEHYNGIVPELAARNHVLYIDKILKKILLDHNLKIKDIGLISATAGPGLIGGLLIGLTFAKTLAQMNNIPFIGINHLEGHALTARLTNNIEFPFLLLLASGGHTNFYFISGIRKYIYLGGTLDDALGEAFDKIANILNLGFPGGAEVEKIAKVGNPLSVDLPKPLINKKNLDMSFSGLKTAVLKKTLSSQYGTKFNASDIAASFQKTIADILSKKVSLAIDYCEEKDYLFQNIVLSGGVAANEYLRDRISVIANKYKKKLCLPPRSLCTDNGAMIAWAGYEIFMKGVKSKLNTKAMPRWPLEKMELFS